jgi:hypothetical protein
VQNGKHSERESQGPASAAGRFITPVASVANANKVSDKDSDAPVAILAAPKPFGMLGRKRK